MAQLTRANLKTKYVDPDTGLYKANTTKAINSDRVRTNVIDEADSTLFWEDIVDEDNMSSNSDTKVPTQQSVKRYADSVIPVGTTSGTNSYTVNTGSPRTVLTSGYMYGIVFGAGSTGAATLDNQSTGAKKIFKDPSTQAGDGDIVAGQGYILMYRDSLDGGNGGYLMMGQIRNIDPAPVALSDSSTVDITSDKWTLATSASTRTFTFSFVGDHSEGVITLSNTSLASTFPSACLCVSEGVASGDNTAALAGSSGDKYYVSIRKFGTAYFVVVKNFGQ